MSLTTAPGCKFTDETDTPLADLHLLDREVLSNPHGAWAKLQSEAPIFRLNMPGISAPVFLVTTRAGIERVAQDTVNFSSAPVGEVWRWGDFPPEIEALFAAKGYKVVHTTVTSDPPNHKKYRIIVEKALSPQRVAALRPKIAQLADELIQALPENEPFNFVDHYSVPLPLHVICLIMGLPLKDADYIRSESDLFIQLVDPSSSHEKAMEGARAVVEGYDYFAAHIRQLRQSPNDSMMSTFANARNPEGELISMDEAISLAQVTAIGGNETTRNAISSCARILATQKPMWETLKQNPTLISTFIEEVLRTNAPATSGPRRALHDVAIDGVSIPKGSSVFLMWGAGSTDPAVLECPHMIDLNRKSGRGHTSFGFGPHFCAGKLLARAELHASVTVWLRDLEAMNLAVSEADVRYEPLLGFRSLNSLPMKIVRTREAANRSPI
jgi:cytochrome P450